METIQGLKSGIYLRHNTYRIEKVLGQGGFGITYLAVDLNLDRYVAIKEFFPKDYCDRDDATSHVTLGTQGSRDFVNRLKAKFLKEARNIARFDSPNIIRIHSAFEENDTAYYVMDYIEGLTLSEIVRKEGPISVDKALIYVNKVGKALEYVHNHNVTHLDIKPANIIIRQCDEEPILIDFGLSKQYDAKGNQTSTTPIGISHGYAPMEQYADGGIKVFSPQTDLYSLAATLYYILSGVVPPQATRLIEDELTFPQSIPSQLISCISKAMSANRKKRHGSIHEFLIQLNNDKVAKNTFEGAVCISEDSHLKDNDPLSLTESTADKRDNSQDNDKNKAVIGLNEGRDKKSFRSVDTEYTLTSDSESEKRRKGVSVWIYGLVAFITVIICVVFFLFKESLYVETVGESEILSTRESFEKALLLLNSDNPDSVKKGFDRMRVLSDCYDSARVEMGITYFPYLPADSGKERFNNPILKRRWLLNLHSTTDADSVIKYLSQVSYLPPEASYILGCTYYEHNDDESKALEMFRQSNHALENGEETGHGYERNTLKSILTKNIKALSK